MHSWPTKKLTDICDLERGTEPGSAFYIEASDKAILFLRIGDLTGKIDAPRFVKDDNDNLQIVNENEMLITFDGTPGIVVRGFKGAIASGIRVVRNIKLEVDGNFLFYYLQTPSVHKTIKVYSKGATIIHASTAIPHIKIPLPPLKIQQKIVERLDAIKKAQELNDKQIGLADELFQSLLHKELNPTGKNWKMKKLVEIADITSGGTPSRKEPEYFKGKIPWVKSGELKNDEIHRTEEYINEEGLKNSSAKLFPVNTILIAMYGATVGKTGILKASATTNQAIASIQANPKIADYSFIYFLLRTKIDFLLSRRFGGAQPNINQNIIKNLKISFPPIETQRKIVDRLVAVGVSV